MKGTKLNKRMWICCYLFHSFFFALRMFAESNRIYLLNEYKLLAIFVGVKELLIHLVYGILVVFIKCSTCKNQCCKHYCTIFYFRALYSFHQHTFGTRYLKCSKSCCCLHQHGWGCNDNYGQDLGIR